MSDVVEKSTRPQSVRAAYPVRLVVLFGLTAVGALACLAMAGPFAPAITWAVALSVATRKPYLWVLGKVKRPSLAAVLCVVTVLLLLVAPVVLLVDSLGGQLLQVADVLRSGAAQDWALGMLGRYPRVASALNHVQTVVSLKQGTQAAAGYAAGRLQGLLAGSVRTLTQAAIMLFTLFFLYRDGDAARDALRSALPVREDQAKVLTGRMAETIAASLQGSVTIAAIQGSLGGFMFWALSVPQALLWAFVMGMLALIPSLGTFLIWMPVAVYLLLSGHAVKAAVLFAWGAGVIGTVDNLLYPTLVGGRLRLHTIPIFFSVLGGIAVFGLSGLVLGPLLLTTTLALLHLWNPQVLPLAKAGE